MLYLVSIKGKKTAYTSLNRAIKVLNVRESSVDDIKVIVEKGTMPLSIGMAIIEKIDHDDLPF
jgi:hypothetical protein